MDDLTRDSPTVASTLPGVLGLIAGRYEVRARLGRGATKEVYLAYDARLDREVAVAIVVGAGASDGGARERVIREAQVTGRLGDHPNVITVHDTGEHDGIPYLVLRAMSGGSLAALLERERPSIDDAIRLGREIAAALAHAHAHGVIHRDVKPDNVWLAADGSAALGDFGIAHQLGRERLTAEGVVVGTVRYLSPEQIEGGDIGPASDLYALGITLYELVTGNPPFVSADATQVLTQHLAAAPVPPSRRVPDIPAALEQLILELLAKEPVRRPASAGQVAAALAAMRTAPDAPPRPAARRHVAVLAARAEVSDPEVLHGLLDRCATVIEQHGGTVERALGDGVVGLFGLAASHEDDALRAARAAIDLCATTTALRVGIEAGEVFLGAGPRGASIATGAPIASAGRLAERATEGEILLGEGIRGALAADASIEPATGRLLDVPAGRPALMRAPGGPFVGRERELEELHAAFDAARAAGACRLVTVVGPPGIGKSRLAGEFLAALGDDATVLAGRCLAYGEGTAYQAITDVVRGLGGEPRQRLEELLADDEQAARGILSAIGLSDEPVQAEETAWALRRLFERLARERPLVVAIEDIHWAQDALLDVIDHVAALSSRAPILLICLTRPELLESRPEWAAPQPSSGVLVLEALGDAHARDLAAALGAGDLADPIARRAEGNPLFVEQLVAVDAGNETSELPASIQAVLAARIDRLDDDHRALLQRAAIEGRTFHAGALAAGLPELGRRDLEMRLVALARGGLIGGDSPAFPGEDAFRFTHALIREAAYAGVPKRERADLHAQLALWLEQRTQAADEIVGYHLEQTCLLAAELGRDGERERSFAGRAARRLAAASQAALGRGDPRAASALLQRALDVLGPGDAARGGLLAALGTALFEQGEVTAATRVLDEAIACTDDRSAQARARVERELVRLEADSGAGTAEVRRVTDAVLPVLQDAADDRGQCRAWSLRARLSFIAGRMVEADDAWATAAACAERAGDDRELFDVIAWRATAAVYGPTPVPEAIVRCEAYRDVVAASPAALALVLNPLAVLHAMDGADGRAEQYVGEANAILDELGGLAAHVPHFEGLVMLLAGRPERAEAALRADVEPLAAMSGEGTLATTTALLAEAVYAQGRIAEADELCRRTSATTAPDDVFTEVIWRAVQARCFAREGRCTEAEKLARDAIAIAEPTDLLSLKGDAMLALADVLRICERMELSSDAVRTCLALYEQKGNAAAARAVALTIETEGGPDAPEDRVHRL